MLSITALDSQRSNTLTPASAIDPFSDLDDLFIAADAPEYKADFEDETCVEIAIDLRPDQIVPFEGVTFLPLTSTNLSLPIVDAITMTRTGNITQQQAQALQSQYLNRVHSVASMSSLTDSQDDGLEADVQALREATANTTAVIYPYDHGSDDGRDQYSTPSAAMHSAASIGNTTSRNSDKSLLWRCLTTLGFNSQ